jgi:hypothetical protein
MTDTYSYDRRTKIAGNPDQILALIVQGVIRDRNVEHLVHAYIEASVEDYKDEHEDQIPYHDVHALNEWYKNVLHIAQDAQQGEKLVQDAYVREYRRRVPRVDQQTAQDVFVWPRGLPTHPLPQEVAAAVGETLARHDAAETNLMREMAQDRAERRK